MARPRILVTGASGFVGSHLLPVLDAAGFDVTGIGPTDRPQGISANCEWHCCDLREAESLVDLPNDWWGVVHLAAESIPGDFRSITPLLSNVAMTVTLLEHVRHCRVLCVSSCHVYAPSRAPVSETAPVHPKGRYGFSKHLTEQTALAFSDRLDIRIARPFNHLGRGMRPELVAPSLLRRVVDEIGTTKPLRMLGLNSTRDFVDVRDVASAYLAILRLESSDQAIFNVCSGRETSIRDLARAALALVGDERSIEFEKLPGSDDDTDYLVGNPAKLQTATGWKATHELKESLAWMLDGLHTAPTFAE